MRKVAQAVGLTAPAIYRHFEDKGALLEAVAESAFEVFERYLSRMGAGKTPRRRIEIAGDCYVDFALEQPRLFELAFLLPRRKVRRFPRDFAAHRSRTGDMLREQVEQCIRTGVFRRGNSLEMALTIWAHAHGLVVMYRAGRFGPGAASFRPLYRRSLQRLLRGLAA